MLGAMESLTANELRTLISLLEKVREHLR